MPPLTPRGCVADAVTSQVFDDLWGDICAQFRPILSILVDSIGPPRPQAVLLQSLSRVTLGGEVTVLPK